MNKIGFLITARLKSTRLPLKLLKDLNGRKIIERVIDRCKLINHDGDIVLCTSINPQDKPLVDIASDNGIYYFMGDEEDVLSRLLTAAKFFDLDCIINITGENPIFSINYANEMVRKMRNENHDFLYIDGLPIGCAVYGIKTKALEVVCKVKEEVDTEIWGYLINQPSIFDVCKIETEEKYKASTIRITTDYPEDYEFIKQIFRNFPSEISPAFEDVIELFRLNPELLKINEKRVQLNLDQEVINRINQFYIDNKERILSLKNKIYNY